MPVTETRVKPKLPDISGAAILEQQSAFPTQIITPPGSYFGHELNTNMGDFGLGNMIAQGTFNEVYRLTGTGSSKELVARACRVPVATDHLSQLLGAIPAKYRSQLLQGDWRLNFQGITFPELINLRNQLKEIIPYSLDPNEFIASTPFAHLRAAALQTYLAENTSVGGSINKPKEVILQRQDEEKFVLFSIENYVKNISWDNLPEDRRLEMLLTYPGSNIQDIAKTLERLYIEAHGIIHGDLKPGHIIAYPDTELGSGIVLDWDTATFMNLEPRTGKESQPQIRLASIISAAPEVIQGGENTKSSEILAFINSSLYALLRKTPRLIEQHSINYDYLRALAVKNDLPFLHNSGKLLNQGLQELGINLQANTLCHLTRFLECATGSLPNKRPGSFTAAAVLITEPILAAITPDEQLGHLRTETADLLLQYYNGIRGSYDNSPNDTLVSYVYEYLVNCPADYLMNLERRINADWGKRPGDNAQAANAIMAAIEMPPL